MSASRYTSATAMAVAAPAVTAIATAMTAATTNDGVVSQGAVARLAARVPPSYATSLVVKAQVYPGKQHRPYRNHRVTNPPSYSEVQSHALLD